MLHNGQVAEITALQPRLRAGHGVESIGLVLKSSRRPHPCIAFEDVVGGFPRCRACKREDLIKALSQIIVAVGQEVRR